MADLAEQIPEVATLYELDTPDPSIRPIRDIYSPVRFITVLGERIWTPFEDLGLSDLVSMVELTENIEKKDSSGKLEMFDPDGSLIESELLSEGTAFSISLGFIGDVVDFGTWVVQEVNPEYTNTGLKLTLNLQSQFVRMTAKKSAERWENIKASQIAEIVASRYGLNPIVDDTVEFLEEFCKGQETDVSMLKKLASAYDYQFYVRGNDLHFHPAGKDKLPFPLVYHSDNPLKTNLQEVNVLKGKYMRGGSKKGKKINVKTGRGLLADDSLELDPEINSEFQSIVSDGRDPIPLDEMYGYIDPVTGENVPFEGVAGSIALGEGLDVANKRLKASHKASLKGVVVRGMCAYGIPHIRPGRRVDIKGIGVKYEGQYTVQTVTHHQSLEGYRTEFEAETKTRARGRKKGGRGGYNFDQTSGFLDQLKKESTVKR